MSSKVAIRFSKIWIAKEPTLILQANILGPLRKACSKKKIFFSIDARQSSFGIKILDKKPDQLTAQSAIINIMRKHSPSFTINTIDENTSNGDLVITILQQKVTAWFLILKKSRPPEIIFIDHNKTSFVRHGAKGTFTKKKQLDIKIPLEGGFEDILEPMVRKFVEKYPADQSIELTENEDDDFIKSPISKEQKDIISRLKRKLKSSNKAIEKQVSSLPTEREVEDCNQ